MIRVLSLSVSLALLSSSHHAAELTAATASVPSAPALAALEGEPALVSSDPEYWARVGGRTQRAFELIESNALTTADELVRVSRFIVGAENRFRGDRVRYELILAAAALGSPLAEKQLAAEWDRLLGSLGRPLRSDFTGLVQKRPEQYRSDLAPASVLAVLRDPPQARVAAKDAERNAEMKTIVDADQADRRVNFSKMTAEERQAVSTRDKERNKRTQEIMKAGELRTAADFANAALVMQHSAHFLGYQTAHELAVCALLLGDRSLGRWLVAATYDRMLGSVGHDQRFGTQYRGAGPTSTLVTVDVRGISDVQRKALGCPTLEQAHNRMRNAATPSANLPKLAAEFAGPNRTVRDAKFGLSATMPEGWKIRDVTRWGDQQNTIFFTAAEFEDAGPSLYYRVYPEGRPFVGGELTAFVREEARKKEASRREGMPDYMNRPDSFKSFTLGQHAAFSWWADGTGSDGEKRSEYFVRIQTDTADALFFVQGPRAPVTALQPLVDSLMAGLTMPQPPK